MIQKNKKEEIEEGLFYGEMKENVIKKSLRNSVRDGVAASTAAGVGDNFVSAYAIAMNASNLQLGILSALPTLMPGEILSTKAMERWSRKGIVTTGVFVQALLWLPIALVSLIFLKNLSYAPIMLIVFYSAYMLMGFFINPAWNSWMKDLTHGREIGQYFGKRNRVAGIAGLIATISAGLILDLFKNRELVFVGFFILFFAACISKFVSRHYLRGQYEPKLKLDRGYYFSFWQFIRKAPSNNYGRFAIFYACINFSTAIATPFFAAYMLKDLHFSYIGFTMISMVVSALATLVMMPIWGNFADRYGNVKTLQIAAFLIPINPMLWLISPSFYWLIFVQIFSGISWAGFNIAASSFTYDAVTKPRMGLCIAYMGTLNSIGIFLGAIIGGLLASFNTIPMNIYLFVFVISGLARLAFTVLLSSKIKEVRPNVRQMKLRLKIWKPLDNTPFRKIGEITELPIHLFGKKV